VVYPARYKGFLKYLLRGGPAFSIGAGLLVLTWQPRASGGKKEGPEALGGVCSAPVPRPRMGRMLHLYFIKRGERVVARSVCTAWRPASGGEKYGLDTSSFAVAHSYPRAPGCSLCLYLKAPASLARGTHFGTMVPSRAAHPYIRLHGIHAAARSSRSFV
jgi:hypothetical protein